MQDTGFAPLGLVLARDGERRGKGMEKPGEDFFAETQNSRHTRAPPEEETPPIPSDLSELEKKIKWEK